MNNASPLIRSLIIYALCLPLALFVGYLVSSPLSYPTLIKMGIVLGLLCLPLLLRWHYTLLLLSWNMTTLLPFMPGRPNLYMAMIGLSILIAVVQHALDRNMKFIYVPHLTWSLVALGAVALVTAKLTGGIGFRSLGGDVYGGRHYMQLLAGILGYFALTSRQIPLEKANLSIGLFFLGGATAAFSDLLPVLPSGMHFIYWIFPVTNSTLFDEFELGTTRLGGTKELAYAVFFFMFARYGMLGILSRKPWRLLLLFICFCLGLLGGYRGYVMNIGLLCILQFCLEGLHRTRWVFRGFSVGLIGFILLIPFASHLPFTFQRALSFLPLEFEYTAIEDAQGTLNWRYEMWMAFMPQVPEHLLLGKGYAISHADYQMMGYDSSFRAVDPTQQALALSSDYHNGFLSVLLPFGIWGLVPFLWFVIAGGRALYLNYRYGDPALKNINTLLFAAFLKQALVFYGQALNSDMIMFAGFVGLSVSLNGGIRRPVREPSPAAPKPSNASHLPARPRSAFGM